MKNQKIAPYGSWKSPITAESIVSAHVDFMQVVIDGQDIYWLERRPSEKGRCVIVRMTPDGEIADITPPHYNVRTRVNEYGGGAFTVDRGTVYFSNYQDQRLYRQHSCSEPIPITPEKPWRFADGIVDRKRYRLICIREDHTNPGGEAVTSLAGINLDGKQDICNLASGHDFYSSPRLSPDGTSLAWLEWDHPNMPWDETELLVANICEDGSLGTAEKIAGGFGESVYQPEWSPDGVLHFVSDRTGWWNLYRYRNGQIEALCEMEAEFGIPQWVFGTSTYSFESPGQIICAFARHGVWHPAMLSTADGFLEIIKCRFTLHKNYSLRAMPGCAIYIGGSPTEASAVVRLDAIDGSTRILRSSCNDVIDPDYISIPKPIEFPTERKRTAHAFFYAPKNKDVTAPADELPPLLVMSHGGPTAATSNAFDAELQFWTSRGIAVLDVNYGGSTGYGREYRRRLEGNWGIVDVDDCINGAAYLAAKGTVDPNRLAIRGGSAGGYTTLAALTFREFFHVGTSRYGVSDLEMLAKETHKFEARYLDRLVGPYPKAREIYRERSPINFVDSLSRPVIFFQGLEDEVVPSDQARMMFNALKMKGVPTAFMLFEGEQHGFRRAENIKAALEGELYFYSRILGFEPADAVTPVPIVNLDSWTG
ncbi:MAG: S9 family peptidase [Candidatus Zixiibacteriota bacterium]|nr:MAG: S9 family peptidase [candidate division Zixibacteria bacterium]